MQQVKISEFQSFVFIQGRSIYIYTFFVLLTYDELNVNYQNFGPRMDGELGQGVGIHQSHELVG